jgi:predicted dehydrogenase
MSGGRVFAAGSDKIRVAMIGCGDRGTKDAIDCLSADPGTEMVAIADMFQDRVDRSLAEMSKAAPEKVKVTPQTVFLGFDAYKKVLAMKDVDMVLLLTPPGFRPQTLRAAVEAGKHIFMEKPGAVDPIGIRSLMESADVADQRKLSIVVGTQQRWQPHYQELMKRVHNGDLGEVVGGQAYWNWGSSKWHWEERKPGWSDMEWQIRCWPYFTWLSGDHIVEQHLHNMDVINWAIGSHPVSCLGMGGRQSRTGPEFGNIWDHFTVEYEYPNGVRVMSMCSTVK